MTVAEKAYRMIDVSANQGRINWQAVRASGIEAAVIRGGFWRTRDVWAEANLQGAAEAGLAVGVYWFMYSLSEADAIAEANACASLLSGKKITLPVFADFEYDTERYAAEKGLTFTKERRTAVIRAFCERIRARGYTPGVYLNPDYILYRVKWDQLKTYSLMLAQWVLGGYVTHGEVAPDSVSKAYGMPAAWQIGLGIGIPGISKEVDLDYGYIAPLNVPDEANEIRRGDRVTVKKYRFSGTRRLGQTYTGGTYVIFYDIYDVISVAGDRVVIGIGNTVTAAVHRSDVKKI